MWLYEKWCESNIISFISTTMFIVRGVARQETEKLIWLKKVNSSEWVLLKYNWITSGSTQSCFMQPHDSKGEGNE